MCTICVTQLNHILPLYYTHEKHIFLFLFLDIFLISFFASILYFYYCYSRIGITVEAHHNLSHAATSLGYISEDGSPFLIKGLITYLGGQFCPQNLLYYLYQKENLNNKIFCIVTLIYDRPLKIMRTNHK